MEGAKPNAAQAAGPNAHDPHKRAHLVYHHDKTTRPRRRGVARGKGRIWKENWGESASKSWDEDGFS